MLHLGKHRWPEACGSVQPVKNGGKVDKWEGELWELSLDSLVASTFWNWESSPDGMKPAPSKSSVDKPIYVKVNAFVGEKQFFDFKISGW